MKKIYILLITFLMFSSPALAMEAKLVEKETRYGTISYPQISGIADKNIEASLNTMIREEADTWNCDFDGERTDEEIKRMSYDAWSVIHTASDEVLSYAVHKDYYYGSAYPSAYVETRNYDLTTGAPIQIFNLIDENKLSGAELTNFILKDYKAGEGTCDLASMDINWDYYLIPDHVVFMPSLPHVAEACWQEFKVENKRLEPYFPGGR